MNTSNPVEKLIAAQPVRWIGLSLLMGVLALNFIPREEEPQIVVPMVDVLGRNLPGLPPSKWSARLRFHGKSPGPNWGCGNVDSTSAAERTTGH